MHTLIPRLSAACLLAALSACASQTPQLDRQFGNATRAAAQLQVLNPGAPTSQAVAGLDGKASKSAYDNYQKSFKDPKPQTGALSISVGQ